MTVIGIDLGTSNSLVAYWKEDGPAIIPNVLGERLTPSIVSVEDNGEILVGKIAKERLITHPHLTASVFKRDMGTEKAVSIGNYNFTPEELSSFIIKSLKADAESFLQEAVTEAVISVPAYFNDNQRKATKRAAEFTGLRVERLISEPTAAALSYGLHQRESDTNFLVFDLGGGTYDVSVLEYFEGVMEVRAIAGDNFLGGEDFTQVIASYFMDDHGINRTSLDKKAYSYIKKQAEKCKHRIGEEGTGEIQWRRGEEMYRTVIDQQKFEQISQPLILRLRQPIERALKDASLTPEDLDAVVLIGGATRMPIVKKIVSKVLGRLPFSQINPDETVALGAAIQAALKERNEALNEMILTDVCPYTLGTDVIKNMGDDRYETGHFYPIIERNTPIPVSKVERFYTASDNQSKVVVEVYQGESRHTKNNHKLGELNFNVKPGPAGSESVDVRYTYDINGILEVECTSVSTGEMERMVIENNPGNYTAEEIEVKLSALKDIKIHPRERSENRLLLAVGERLYEESLGDKRIKIADMIDAFECVLATQDEQKVVKAASSFKNELDHLERWQDY